MPAPARQAAGGKKSPSALQQAPLLMLTPSDPDAPGPPTNGRPKPLAGRQRAPLYALLALALCVCCAADYAVRTAQARGACLEFLLTTARGNNTSGGGGGGGGGGPAQGFSLNASSLPPLPRALRRQIDEDLQPWRDSGVTLKHVEQAYCGSYYDGFRLQVIGGKMYVAGLTIGWQTRLLSMARLLFRVHREMGPLPDLDFVLEQQDFNSITPTSPECPERGPLFQHNRFLDANGSTLTDQRHIVLIPDWSWAEWIEATMLRWEEEWELLRLAAAARPWEGRANDCYFRGQESHPARRVLKESLQKWRNASAAGGNETADILLKTLAVHIQEGYAPEPFPTHCDHKVLLNIAGQSNSGRFKYLFSCQSSIIEWVLPTHNYKEFWYNLLKNGTNVFRLPWVEGSDPAVQLFQATQHLLADDAAARKLGKGAAALFKQLQPHVPLLYWRTLLQEYASMLRFKPELHSDAVPIEQVLGEMARVTKLHSDRTCKMCPGRPPPAR